MTRGSQARPNATPARERAQPYRVVPRLFSDPEWEAVKSSRRNLHPRDAVAECAYLSAQYRSMWRSKSPVEINLRRIPHDPAGEKDPVRPHGRPRH